VGGITGGIIFIALFPLIWPFLEEVLRLRAGMTGRESIWALAIEIISNKPFTGIGPANFQPRFILDAPFMRNGAFTRLGEPTAHNVFLHIGAEVGIFGPLLALSLVGLFIIRNLYLWPYLKGTPHFATLMALIAMFTAAFARSLFETELAFQHGNLYKNVLIIVILAFQDNLSTRTSPSR
jgi:O-antigen ligase